MAGTVEYFSSKEQLIERVKTMLAGNSEPDMMISGVWTKSLYEDIFQLIMEKQSCSSCRVIIPKLIFKGDISLILLRNICKAEGRVRVNNAVTNNLLIIDGNVFILSFSSRLSSLNILSTSFECAVMLDDKEIVDRIKTQFTDIFENSVPFRM
ncbi:MAG: hypothetical protein ACM3TR_13275 [Caulobacteraceae bacterium]